MHFSTRLIGQELVSVQPLNKPAGLVFLDYIYVDKLKERRQKIEKLYERIKLKQEVNTNDHTTEFLEYQKCNKYI
jgi:hypothetical protein